MAAQWDERAGEWEVGFESGLHARARFLVTALGPLSAPTMPRIDGIEDFQGECVAHGSLAARARELREQARGRDRNRCVRGAGDHRDREDGRRAHGVPAHAELVRAAPQRADRRRGDGADPRELRGDLRALPRDLRLLHPRRRPAQRARRDSRGARGVLREALPAAGLRVLAGELPRHPHRPRRERHRDRVRDEEDPRARPGPEGRGSPHPEGPRLRHATGTARERLLRGLQPAERASSSTCAPRRSSESRRPACARASATTSST